MPRKVFVAGEILTAADVNTNLMDQAVMTFAGTAARGSAIGTAVEGMVTYLEDSDSFEYWDSSAWVPVVPDFDLTSPVSGDSLVYDGSNWVNTSQVSGDNLLYNGAMQVAQRGTSETGITGTTSGYYTADRWDTFLNIGTWTQTVAADAPTGSGFANSLKMEITAGAGSTSAGSYTFVRQALEGQDLQGIKKGSSSAESLTVSFWVKSDTTGTYIVEMRDNDNTRQISQSYTVDSADTWEKKTLTFAGDTTGVLDNDNLLSVVLQFWLVAGSDFSSGTLDTSWATYANSNRAVGQTNLAASTSNYWQVTGVQLETGTVASGFDHKPFGVELAECQRYYYNHGENVGNIGIAFAFTATQANTIVQFPVTMRGNPSLVSNSGTGIYTFARNGGFDLFDSLTLSNPSVTCAGVTNSTEISSTAGQAGLFEFISGGSLAFDSEL